MIHKIEGRLQPQEFMRALSSLIDRLESLHSSPSAVSIRLTLSHRKKKKILPVAEFFCELGNGGYNSASPWTGKLRATCQAIRNRLWCSHRSDEEAGSIPAVSRVGRHRRMDRDVACATAAKWQWVAPCRPRTSHHKCQRSTHRNKTEQRRPATRWAMRRKTCMRQSMEWASGTKTPGFGLTERGLRGRLGPFSLSAINFTAGMPQAWPKRGVVCMEDEKP